MSWGVSSLCDTNVNNLVYKGMWLYVCVKKTLFHHLIAYNLNFKGSKVPPHVNQNFMNLKWGNLSQVQCVRRKIHVFGPENDQIWHFDLVFYRYQVKLMTVSEQDVVFNRLSGFCFSVLNCRAEVLYPNPCLALKVTLPAICAEPF